MNNFEDYLFWRLAHYFIQEQGYRIIQLSENQKELWLEKKEDKSVQAIRLLRYDLNWSNWMKRDVERTVHNGEMLRKQMVKREVSVLNFYISAYGPVDNYFDIEKPFLHPVSKKTQVVTKIIERQNYADQLERLGALFEKPMDILTDTDSISAKTEELKKNTLTEAANRVKKERTLFQHGKPFFTYIFMIIQIIVYFLLEKDGGSQNSITLIDYGAKFNPLILEGEWWRFITPMFLHIGFLHLFMNTLALFYLGTVVERIFGNVRFLVIYLIAGFGGTLASFLFSTSISAGASGAIFGCFGALLYFGLIYPKLFFRTMGLNIIFVLAITLALGFTISGVDNAGHIGGIVGGFLATGIVHFPKKKKLALQLLFLISTIAITVTSLSYGYNHPDKIVDESNVFSLSQYYVINGESQKAYDYMTTSSIYKKGPSANYLFILAEIEYGLGKLDDAVGHLQRGIELNPNMDEAHYYLSAIYRESGQYEKALHHLQKAVEIDPDEKLYSEELELFKEQRGVLF